VVVRHPDPEAYGGALTAAEEVDKVLAVVLLQHGEVGLDVLCGVQAAYVGLAQGCHPVPRLLVGVLQRGGDGILVLRALAHQERV
jgi:hypothetical protein